MWIDWFFVSLCAVNILMAGAMKNWHSAMGWCCAILYGIIVLLS